MLGLCCKRTRLVRAVNFGADKSVLWHMASPLFVVCVDFA